jgi:para-nitrobenzyl esterase
MAEWADAQAQFGKAPTYAYLFARRQPYAQNIQFSDHDPATVGAYHSGDVPYWLGTKDSLNLFRTTRLWEPGDQAIEAEMSTALLNFAQNGAPASPVVGAWPAFKRSAPRLVWLDMQSRVIDWPHYSDMGLLSALSIQRPQSQRPRD